MQFVMIYILTLCSHPIGYITDDFSNTVLIWKPHQYNQMLTKYINKTPRFTTIDLNGTMLGGQCL